MSKAGTIMVRVHPKLLKSASRVLRYVGVNTPEAITLLMDALVLKERACERGGSGVAIGASAIDWDRCRIGIM